MLLVAVGLIALWVVITGRLDRVVMAWQTLVGDGVGNGEAGYDEEMRKLDKQPAANRLTPKPRVPVLMFGATT